MTKNDKSVDDGGPAFPICPGQGGPVAERFLKYVNGGDFGLDTCWLWTGARSEKGYGQFALTHRHQVRAHRYSLHLYLGREPKGLVLHSCDNPSCVNPLHLSEGTHEENMRQMATRKRAAREEYHHKAKIKFVTAAAIILLHRSGDYSTREIASALGISQPTVAQICKGHLWPDAYTLVDSMLRARKEPRS